ncbi:hypothetical protein [Streptomyces zagrosensis]|uniref:Uncharacterized protein n=1 Tax=Streptomyces zagrosensis TaxID=1042984 RepID=A0A7W9V2U7_9ACTN|nr:hypothetical protein [Streptomyces zagrosensis]MBB5940337.1 hypothetical protein [Streptomyces zagrosensis]
MTLVEMRLCSASATPVRGTVAETEYPMRYHQRDAPAALDGQGSAPGVLALTR